MTLEEELIKQLLLKEGVILRQIKAVLASHHSQLKKIRNALEALLFYETRINKLEKGVRILHQFEDLLVGNSKYLRVDLSQKLDILRVSRINHNLLDDLEDHLLVDHLELGPSLTHQVLLDQLLFVLLLHKHLKHQLV